RRLARTRLHASAIFRPAIPSSDLSVRPGFLRRGLAMVTQRAHEGPAPLVYDELKSPLSCRLPGALDFATPGARLPTAALDELFETFEIPGDAPRDNADRIAHGLDHAVGLVLELQHHTRARKSTRL